MAVIAEMQKQRDVAFKPPTSEGEGRAASTKLDPAACPKGKVQFDTMTGERVTCTGDPEGLGWLAKLQALVTEPASSHPTKTERDKSSGDMDYTFAAFGPFKELSVHLDAGQGDRWSLSFKATKDVSCRTRREGTTLQTRPLLVVRAEGWTTCGVVPVNRRRWPHSAHRK